MTYHHVSLGFKCNYLQISQNRKKPKSSSSSNTGPFNYRVQSPDQQQCTIKDGILWESKGHNNGMLHNMGSPKGACKQSVPLMAERKEASSLCSIFRITWGRACGCLKCTGRLKRNCISDIYNHLWGGFSFHFFVYIKWLQMTKASEPRHVSGDYFMFLEIVPQVRQ